MRLILLFLLFADDLDSLKKKFEDEKSKPYAERTATLAKIGALKTDDAAAFLEGVFDSDKDTSVRSYALTSLGTCGTDRAIKKLVSIVKDDKQPVNFRSSALSALGRSKSKDAFDLIFSIAKDKDPKNLLRFSAFSALSSFPLGQTEALWREALTDPQPTIRGYAFRALAPLKDKTVLDLAKKAIEDPQEQPYVKSAAVEPWKALGGPEAVQVLLAAEVTPDPALRKTIADFFAALKDEKAVEALLDGMRHPSPAVRSLVARALGKLKHPRAMEVLEAALKDKDVDVRIAAIESIAERKDPKSEEILQREAQRGEDEAVAAAINGLASCTSESTLKLLLKLAKHSHLTVKVSAIDALGDLRTEKALDLFEDSLKAREWPVRAAAIRGLGKLKMRESVDLLIERMPKEEGRLLADIVKALETLTGKDLGFSPGHWRDWWKANRDKFVFPEKTTAGGGGSGSTTTYHGVPIVSKRIIFCLDISGSMSATTDNKTRLDQAKEELARVLKSLDKGVMMNLIFFDDRIEPWQKQLVAIKPNLDKALAKVGELKPRGGTNIYDTLERAFEDPNVDTIFLLSDGSPGSGKFVNTDDILREIKKLNRSRQIVIHTISLGSSPFMKKLAEENGGQYVEKK